MCAGGRRENFPGTGCFDIWNGPTLLAEPPSLRWLCKQGRNVHDKGERWGALRTLSNQSYHTCILTRYQLSVLYLHFFITVGGTRDLRFSWQGTPVRVSETRTSTPGTILLLYCCLDFVRVFGVGLLPPELYCCAWERSSSSSKHVSKRVLGPSPAIPPNVFWPLRGFPRRQ